MASLSSIAGADTVACDTEVDVVVVGGGFSGLKSAYDLQQSGLSTVVLEAKEAIGGRSRSINRKSGEGIIELGATWINNTTQPRVTALVDKFGLDTAVQYTAGDSVFQGPDGEARRIPPGSPNAGNEEDAAVEISLLGKVSEAAEAVNITYWKDYPEDQDLTVDEWVAKHGYGDSSHARGLAGHLVRALVGREPHETGVHYLLDYIKSGLGLESLNSEDEGGAQYLKIKQGTTSIATNLAKAMTPGSVLVSTPVKAIKQHKDTSIVTAQTGQVFKAKKVIIAIPTNTYRDITFSPPLPKKKETLVSNTKPGIYGKMILSYNEPWWRDAGLVGKFTSVSGPVCFSWDTSDPAKSQYSLAVFIAGDIATRWHALSDAERKSSIISHLESLVGKDLASKARDVLEINYAEWTKEEFIWGAPTSAMGPGLLRKYGDALRESYGNLHFGGGETAYEWKGYLEGAVRAGERVAAEVIEALGKGQK
uniref:Amine oxidase n=1 Tax=Bionectria ochroleuca TaxID=29856 RepID=A0A8H7NQJ8_BIOOC